MTDRALAWVRSSKGSDDKIGLEEQREAVPALARNLADEVDQLDLGIQTGFSSMTRDDDAGLLDHQEDVQAAVERLEAGEYDVIVAYDDRRICRDEYLRVIEYAAKQGDAEFAFVEDVPEDDMAYDIRHRVERETKEEEIRKSRRAVERRQEQGFWQGKAPFGYEFQNGQLVRHDTEYETARDILLLRDRGKSYRKIEADTGVPRGTIGRVLENRQRYENDPLAPEP